MLIVAEAYNCLPSAFSALYIHFVILFEIKPMSAATARHRPPFRALFSVYDFFALFNAALVIFAHFLPFTQKLFSDF